MSTIISFPSAPINGGTFDLRNNVSTLSVCQLESNKFLVIYRQTTPSYTLGQVIEIVDENTINFNNVWVVNGIQTVDALMVRALSENKAILCCSKISSPSISYFQILEIDSANDIIAGPLVSFKGGTNTGLDYPYQLSVLSSTAALYFFHESRVKASRIRVSSMSIEVSAPFIAVSADSYNAQYGNYFPETINSEVFYYGGKTGQIFRVGRLSYSNLFNFNTSVSASDTQIGATLNLPGDIKIIDGVVMATPYIYFSVATSTNQYGFVESNTATNTNNFIPILTAGAETEFKTIAKVDDYHFVGFDAANYAPTSANATLSHFKVNVYRILEPGILKSPASPIAVSGTHTVRTNTIGTYNSLRTNLNKNTFTVSPSMVAHFYKTDTDYRIALLYG